MRRLVLLAVALVAVVSMAVSPALAHDSDGDGCDEDFFDCLGFWAVPVWGDVEYDIDWDNNVDFDEDWDDWDDVDVECEVEDIDYSGVFEEWEVDLACGWE